MTKKTLYILTDGIDVSIVNDEKRIDQDDMEVVVNEHGVILQVVVDEKFTPLGYQVRQGMVQASEDDEEVLEIYDWEVVR